MRRGDFRRSDNVEDRTGEAAVAAAFRRRRHQARRRRARRDRDREPAVRRQSARDDRHDRGRRSARAAAAGRAGAPGLRTAAAPGRPAADAATEPGKDGRRACWATPKTSGARCSRRSGAPYEPPTLVLFRLRRRSACGHAVAAAGPVLLPGGPQALSRHRVLRRTGAPLRRARRFRAGVRDRARSRPSRAEPDRHRWARSTAQRSARTSDRGNALSVRLELQADCYRRRWGYFAQRRGKLDTGDVEEGLRAAAAVGDDQIQKQTQGEVVPESFTRRLGRAAHALVQDRPSNRRHPQLRHVRARPVTPHITACPGPPGVAPCPVCAPRLRPPAGGESRHDVISAGKGWRTIRSSRSASPGPC